MSCQLCTQFAGLNVYCLSGHYVHNAYLSVACDDYECKVGKCNDYL